MLISRCYPSTWKMSLLIRSITEMLDTNNVIKCVSLSFQCNFIIIIEVIHMVERAFINLDNLKDGKGKRMLKFAEEVQSTGQYPGVQLNRHRQ